MSSPTETDTASSERLQRLRAIALMCGAVTVFSVLDTGAKYLSNKAGLPVSEIIWMRFVSNVALNLLMFGPLLFVALVKSPIKPVHIARSLFMAMTTGLNFLALRYLQLDQTVTIFFIAPFFIAALGGPLLGEWIGWRRMTAILVGFSGVLFVTRPGFGGIHFAVIYSFGAALSYALYSLSTRYLTRREAANVVQFSAPMAGVLVFLPQAFGEWIWPQDWIGWLLLPSLGFIGGFGHWLLVLAHRGAPAPILAPFAYFGLPSMVALEMVAFGDRPDWWTMAGAAIIIGAGIYLIWREQS